MSQSDRPARYALWAELLAEPPEWRSLPGREWPLFDLLTRLAAESDAARHALDLVAGIPSEEVDQRRQRYASLFQAGRPRFWLYESAARTGKILGEPTFAMAQLLQAAGLEAAGAELPDHISLELAFLAYLVGRGNISLYEKQFLEKRGAWMIDLGRALAQSGDAVYAIIGALLANWLIESTQHATRNTPTAQHAIRNTHHATRTTQPGNHATSTTTHATRHPRTPHHATRATRHAPPHHPQSRRLYAMLLLRPGLPDARLESAGRSPANRSGPQPCRMHPLRQVRKNLRDESHRPHWQ